MTLFLFSVTWCYLLRHLVLEYSHKPNIRNKRRTT